MRKKLQKQKNKSMKKSKHIKEIKQLKIEKTRGIIYVRPNGAETPVIKHNVMNPESETYLSHDIDVEEQERICRNFCTSYGIEVCGVYRDGSEVNGLDTTRNGLRGMMNQIRRHPVDVIVVTTIDRITPSGQGYIDLLDSFWDNGVEVASVNGGNKGHERFAEGMMLPL